MIPDWLSLTHPIEMYGVLALAGSCLLYAFIVQRSPAAAWNGTRDSRIGWL